MKINQFLLKTMTKRKNTKVSSLKNERYHWRTRLQSQTKTLNQFGRRSKVAKKIETKLLKDCKFF